MAIYFIIFLILSFFALFKNILKFDDFFLDFTWYFLIIFLIIFIGFRFDTGGDWGRFESVYITHSFALNDIFKSGHDFGYELLSLIFKKMNLNFSFVTLILSTILILSISSFSQKNEDKWLTLLIAFPYLITVVGMGFFRQGAALGFCIFALLKLYEKKNLYFLVFIFFAVSMHKSALIFLPFYFLAQKPFLRHYLFLFLFIIFLYIFLKLDIIRLWDLYVGADKHLESRGTYIRYWFNFIPSIFFIFYSNKLSNSKIEKKIFLIISWLVVLSFPLLFLCIYFFRQNINLFCNNSTLSISKVISIV